MATLAILLLSHHNKAQLNNKQSHVVGGLTEGQAGQSPMMQLTIHRLITHLYKKY